MNRMVETNIQGERRREGRRREGRGTMAPEMMVVKRSGQIAVEIVLHPFMPCLTSLSFRRIQDFEIMGATLGHSRP